MNKIHFADQGQGSVIVFLHGLCETHHIWKDYIKELSTTHRVIAPDLPGFGESHFDRYDFSLDDIAKILKDFLSEELGLSSFSLIGHSLGGYITMSFAANYPEYLDSFGLYHSTAMDDSPEKKEKRAQAIAQVKDKGIDSFLDGFVPGLFAPDNKDKMKDKVDELRKICGESTEASFIAYSKAMKTRNDNTHVLKQFNKPMFIIAGDQDPSVPLRHAIIQSKLSDKIRLKVLQNTGHVGMYEAPNEAMAFVKSFFA